MLPSLPAPQKSVDMERGCKPKATSRATNMLRVELISLAQQSPEDPGQQDNPHSVAEHPPDYFFPKSDS